jgi:hypothetical protein
LLWLSLGRFQFTELGDQGFTINVAHQLAEVLELPAASTVAIGESLELGYALQERFWQIKRFQLCGFKLGELFAQSLL